MVQDIAIGRVIQGDNLDVLGTIPDATVDLIYIDPPFNTGRRQTRQQLRTTASETGSRAGFAGRTYDTEILGSRSYADTHDDFLGFIEPRLVEAYRVLAPTGALYFHIDYREAHYCKVLLDTIFGRASFINELIWAYDYGARTTRRWPAKHDTIFFYAKDPGNYTFNAADVDREPYMAPGLVGPEKAAHGKFPTDVWWHTIVSPTGREKTGYPTQKPLGILRRIVTASSNPGDLVLDFFAGSGTTGAAALEAGRRFILVDCHGEAIAVMRDRFAGHPDVEFK
ncbi:MAG: site-specific DNA-methyltransferase [Chloroflexota bacterium]|nr:site-specific DNA-methyltransferase [Chloroflexota bacterium]